MKTTKQLLEELQNKSAFNFAWSVFWRGLLIYLSIAFTVGLIVGLLNL